MVLQELGQRLTAALRKINNHQQIDEKILNEILTEIASALLYSDVNIHYVDDMRKAVKTSVQL